jgi:hypothetical protein
LVALGRAVTVVPASIRKRLARDLAAVPVRDAPTIALHVAWPQSSTSGAVAAFVRAATAAGQPGHRHRTPPGADRRIVTPDHDGGSSTSRSTRPAHAAASPPRSLGPEPGPGGALAA